MKIPSKKRDRPAAGAKKLAFVHRMVTRAYSGERAKAIAAGIHRHDRHITHPHYDQSVRFCRDLMKRLGFDDVELLRFPIDGKRFYGDWKTPKYWDVRRAYLQLKIGGRWQTFADYRRIPTSVFVYSAPTGREIRTQLVSQTSPDTRGKLVFSGDDHVRLPELRQLGALGVVTDYAPNWPGVRTDRDFRDGHRWDNSFLLEDDHGRVGFSLSRNQGVVVRKELEEQGAIECRFRVDGRLGKGDFLCATGCLRGAERPDEEVVVVSHLYEAGANDNASGVAGSIEALRAIRTLVRDGVLPAPARTLRVVFAFEIVGFLAYFTRRARRNARYVAGVNPDMIGEDQKKCRSVLHVYRTPDSVANFADPLLIDFIRRSAHRSFQHELMEFIVNDNIVSDPTIGIPCPALIHLRDRFYHSSEDTIDKVSSRTLKTVGGAMAAYLYAAAALGPDTAAEVAELCVRYAKERIEQARKAGLTRRKLDYILECENRRLSSVEQHGGASVRRARERIAGFAARIRIRHEREPAIPGALVREAKSLVPARTVMGPLTMQRVPLASREKLKFRPMWSVALNLPLFWVDGKRNLFEIYRRTACERSKLFGLEAMVEYFRFLDGQGLIRLRRVPASSGT